MPIEFERKKDKRMDHLRSDVQGTDNRQLREVGDEMPTQAMADRQTDPVPETEKVGQPVTAHQDRRHK
jgi:hypothetical protein